MPFSFSVLAERLAVCRLDAEDDLPVWSTVEPLFSVTRTAAELSIVCPQRHVPLDVKCERGFRALKLDAQLDLSSVGIVASLATPLAGAGVSVFVISTFDTDYLLVREAQLGLAVDTLAAAGHDVREEFSRAGR